jgi:hypothetical protein
MEDFKKTLEGKETVRTENGAIVFKTSGERICDLTFNLPKLRNSENIDILNSFVSLWKEDHKIAFKWLFYVGDVREGLGERKVFKSCIGPMLATLFSEGKIKKADLREILINIPEYTRWDRLVELVRYPALADEVTDIIKQQIYSDYDTVRFSGKKGISLLAKWLPSEKAHSADTKAVYKCLIKKLHWDKRFYRKTVSTLRKYIKVTETLASANKWSEIDYSAVPSKANLKYKDAFLKHDGLRRTKYLNDLTTGKTKINSKVATPPEILSKYVNSDNYTIPVDDTVEAMWKALPDKLDKKDSGTIVVCDTSSSMRYTPYCKGIKPFIMADALSIYFSERLSGPFKDKVILFSSKPKYIDLSFYSTLNTKYKYLLKYSEYSNTDIEKTFDLLLETAVENNLSQSQIPSRILIISDMEFDSQVEHPVNTPLFKAISDKWRANGLKMPHLVFWNVASRTGGIPMRENELGITLVSGDSINTIDMVLSGKTNPYDVVMEQINRERYRWIDNLDFLNK